MVKEFDGGNGLNDKKGQLLCHCGRGMFSSSDIVISIPGGVMVKLETCFKLNCLKCAGSFVVRRLKKGCVSAFPSSNEAEKIIEEARKEEIDSSFKKADMEAEAGLIQDPK